ncbi:MAG: thiamine biosynthesis lipoprotein [Verrucomicrobiales bacterium]|jgi:thiamine biosynthesis lipoprotein
MTQTFLLRRLGVVGLGLVFLAALVGCQKGDKVEQRSAGEAMGTTWSLRYSGDKIGGVEMRIAARLNELEDIFSTWREDSLVSRWNRGEIVSGLPEEYWEVAAIADEVKEKSNGAFDVEVGKSVAAAGFGSEFSGTLDFSGIAKGFALDEIEEVLQAAGVEAFLFELGGELLARGERDWRVGLESPEPGSVGEVRRVITLRDAAVATSGTYRLFRGDANHLIDPRTRKPVAHDCVSVSVVAATCAEADAWATALMVLGADEGSVLAEQVGVRAFFVRKTPDDGFIELE